VNDPTILLKPLRTDDELASWLRLYCGIRVPRRSVCPHHVAPFDYVRRAYFEPSSDQVVHAPRGGGKTRLAAAATLLDLLHKPGIAVRILGGSLDQSLRMWEHLLPDLQRVAPDLIERVSESRQVRLAGGSTCAVLTQSQRAVRGLRLQKLRCDEVELFDPAVWEAAQLVTRSVRRRGQLVRGAIDALSTLHVPGGLMQRVIDNAATTRTPVVRWCVLDVLERCPPERVCGTCPLWDECQGRAKSQADGFLSIDDAIAMKRRVSLETWRAEMLCERPGVRDAVFPHFDSSHIVAWEPNPDATTRLAIDFGFAAPFVCLWIAKSDDLTHVIDEYVQPQRTLDEHLTHIASRPWAAREASCDPAGAGRNEQTAASAVQVMREAGYVVRYRASRLVDGIEQIRAALKPASGPARLRIDPRCRRLIAAMSGYRYARSGEVVSELPLKDGTHDHLVDALRYHFVNECPREVTARRY
jgi:hypothetical protein